MREVMNEKLVDPCSSTPPRLVSREARRLAIPGKATAPKGVQVRPAWERMLEGKEEK